MRHPTPPQWKPPPQKKLDAGNRSRLTAASYLPTPFRCGEAGSPCLSRCLWETVRQCANSSECGAERSAASRTGRQCVSETERISTPPRDFRHSRGGWTERRGKQGALKAWDLMWVLLPIRSDYPITDSIRGYVLLLLSGSWFVRRTTRGRLID